MKYNMNITDILIRYMIGYLVVMIGFLSQQVFVMILGMPFIIIGLLGMCPLFRVLGIDRHVDAVH
ncbi:DUF2892 domain-containing protein [Chitinophagales bacterium]|nr:DUF2892 domain-containing protein [Chitinophagales bacterium]